MNSELTRINLHWNGMYGYKVEGDGEYNSFTGSYVLASDYDAIAAEVERLQQRAEAAESKARELAEVVFRKSSTSFWSDQTAEVWRDTLNQEGGLAADYLVSVGILEHHPERDWYRFVSQEEKQEAR